MKVRVVIHLHTQYSLDSNITLSELLAQCKEHKVSCLGITDHNNMQSVTAYEKELMQNGIRLIAGEEVRTTSGEIIGLFLKSQINTKGSDGKWITLEKAVHEIKTQNGLVIVPHPFDKLRLGIGRKNILKIAGDIDAMEVFNSRTKINFFNKNAQAFANEMHLVQTVGPDAHIQDEIGNAIMEMEDFSTKEEFLQNLKTAKFYTKRFKLKNIVRPTMNKIGKRMRKYLRRD